MAQGLSAAAAPAESRRIATHVWVVSEDEPAEWRVADRLSDSVFGPFSTEAAALAVAFEGVRFSSRWEVHVLDRFGTLTGSYNSIEDSMHVAVD
jgi:hypothetical protein